MNAHSAHLARNRSGPGACARANADSTSRSVRSGPETHSRRRASSADAASEWSSVEFTAPAIAPPETPRRPRRRDAARHDD